MTHAAWLTGEVGEATWDGRDGCLASERQPRKTSPQRRLRPSETKRSGTLHQPYARLCSWGRSREKRAPAGEGRGEGGWLGGYPRAEGPRRGQGRMDGSVSVTVSCRLGTRTVEEEDAHSRGSALAVRGSLTLLIILKPAWRIFLANL